MPYGDSDAVSDRVRAPVAIKILIAGGFGVGKTTLVSSVSEVRPLRTEESLSEPSSLVDALDGVELKSTTTVAMDFGRISISDDLVVYLFGTPGQKRFWFMWDELAYGALGAVVLADTRRLAECFPSIDYFERRGMPFVVAVNCFDDARRYPLDAMRGAEPDAGRPAGAVRRAAARVKPGRTGRPGRARGGTAEQRAARHFRHMSTRPRSSVPPAPSAAARTRLAAPLLKPLTTSRSASPSNRSMPTSMSTPGCSISPSV